MSNSASASPVEQFFSLDNFQLAWRRIRNSSRLEVKDRLSLKVFASDVNLHLEILIDELRQQLENTEFQFEQPPYLYVPKKARTLRPFTFLSIRDRLVYQALGNIIIKNAFVDLRRFANKSVFSPVLQSANSDFLFEPAQTKGDKPGQYRKFVDSIERSKRNLECRSYVRADISAFYPSIDHDLLINCLWKYGWLPDPKLRVLLANYLGAWSPHHSEYRFRRGLPIGYETSDILGSLFLFEVDSIMSQYCIMRRYVDDMYLFATDKEQAVYALTQLDLLLQQRALTLQTSKVSIEDNNPAAPESESHAKFRYQKDMSLIVVELNGPQEDNNRAQQELQELFEEVWYPKDIAEDQRLAYVLNESEPILAFIFNRLEYQADWIRDVALYLLDEMPARSFHITRYLSLFKDDRVVIEKLQKKVLNPRVYSYVRANCLKALIQIFSDPDPVYEIAREWFTPDHEWILRLTAIDILQNDPKAFDLLLERTQLEAEPDEHLRASAYHACFALATNSAFHRDLIASALYDPSYLVQILGVYLWRHQSNLSWEEIRNQRPLPELVQKLKLDDLTAYRQAEVRFRNEMAKFTGFDISEDLRLFQIFDDVEGAVQLLANAQNASETDVNMLVYSIGEFCRLLISGHQRLLATEPITGNALRDLCNSLDMDISERLAVFLVIHDRLPERLNGASIFGSARPAGGIQAVQKQLRSVKIVIALLFAQIHEYFHTAIPANLTEFLENSSKPAQDTTPQSHPHKVKIFVSYSHEDEKLKIDLLKAMSGLECNALADIWHDRKLLPGDTFDSEINDKLDRSQIVLLLVSADFMASEYCKMEMNRALVRHKRQETRVIPIILRDCDWETMPFGNLNALPTSGKAITNPTLWPTKDAALKDVAKALRRLIEEISKN